MISVVEHVGPAIISISVGKESQEAKPFGEPLRITLIYVSRLRYHQMYIPRAVKRMEQTAPPDADLKSWRY